MKRVFIFLKLAIFLLLGSSTHSLAQDKNIVTVYRWYIPADSAFATVADNEYDKAALVAKGWTNPTLLFYAYHKPGPNTLPVFGWYNPHRRQYMSIAQGEQTDQQMKANGYTGKHLQFYALTVRSGNTIHVSRWVNKNRKSWLTAPDNDTTSFDRIGYTGKMHQYYGLLANK